VHNILIENIQPITIAAIKLQSAEHLQNGKIKKLIFITEVVTHSNDQ